MNGDRVYMLASDHRWQWEEWCEQAGVLVARIGEVKALVVEAFLAAREESPAIRQSGSLLLDLVYAAPQVERALALGIPVATPAEKAGVFPLAWGFDSFEQALPGTLAKVLIRYRPEWPADVREAQFEKLRALQDWCVAHGRSFLIEIVVMREREVEPEFEETGRPAILAEVIRESYARGITPQLWKIEGTSSREGARLIDAAIREREGCAQIILGKGADTATIDRWFDAAAASPSAIGFAIGRSVCWQPGTRYLRGELTADAAVRAMADTYVTLVQGWEQRVAAARPAGVPAA